MILRTSTLVFACAFASCSNYDFAKARKPNGDLDIPRLIADLKASGEEKLSSGIWIPLVYLDLTTFGASDPRFPAGYTLTRLTGAGPIFSVANASNEVVDEHGARIERHDLFALGCGVLFYDYEQRVETPSGQRLQERRRFALLLGKDDTVYARQQP